MVHTVNTLLSSSIAASGSNASSRGADIVRAEPNDLRCSARNAPCTRRSRVHTIAAPSSAATCGSNASPPGSERVCTAVRAPRSVRVTVWICEPDFVARGPRDHGVLVVERDVGVECGQTGVRERLGRAEAAAGAAERGLDTAPGVPDGDRIAVLVGRHARGESVPLRDRLHGAEGTCAGLEGRHHLQVSPVATTIALPRSSTATSGSKPPATRSCAGPKLPPLGRKAACTVVAPSGMARVHTSAALSSIASCGWKKIAPLPASSCTTWEGPKPPPLGRKEARTRATGTGGSACEVWKLVQATSALSRSSNTTCGLLESSPGADSVSTGAPRAAGRAEPRLHLQRALLPGGPDGDRVAALVGGDLRLGGGHPLG